MKMPSLFTIGFLFTLEMLGILFGISHAMAQDMGSRSIATSQVTTTTAAAITVIARANRQAVTIQNHGAVAVYCGPTSSVSSSTGFRIPGVDGASITIPSSAVIWCIAASGTQAVSIIESF